MTHTPNARIRLTEAAAPLFPDLRGAAGKASAEARAKKQTGNENPTTVERPLNDRSITVDNPLQRNAGQSQSQPQSQAKPSYLGIQSPGEAGSPDSRPAPTAENGLNGWENGEEAVGGFYFSEAWRRIVDAARIDLARWTGTEIAARQWLMAGIEPETIVAAIARCAARRGYKVPGTLAYFEGPVRETHGKKAS